MSNEPKDLKNDSTYTVRTVKTGSGHNSRPVKECGEQIKTSVKE